MLAFIDILIFALIFTESLGSIEHELPCEYACPNQEVVTLPEIEDHWATRDKIIFIESARNSSLGIRQACAIESAIEFSGGLPALLVLTSHELHLGNNATCQLFNKYSEKDLFVRHVNLDKIFVGTPLEKLWESQVIQKSSNSIVQTSDALRLVLLHKYGGYYSDLDMVYFKPFNQLKNFISGDLISHREHLEHAQRSAGTMFNNAIFHMEKSHPFLKACLDQFPSYFYPEERQSGGPELMTRIFLNEMCKSCYYDPQKRLDLNPKTFPPEKCQGIHVVPQSFFYLYGVYECQHLYFDKKTPDQWQEKFSGSYGCHMVSSSTITKRTKILRPKFYGSSWPAYLYLAINYCPLSYYSEANF